jgi:hypothetical protein
MMAWGFLGVLDVTMTPRSAGRTSRPDKPVKDTAFEQSDEHQHHQEESIAI